MGSSRGDVSMTSVLNNNVASHIFKHIERSWERGLPTGAPLEGDIARGFLDNNEHVVEQFGGPGTITDVKIDKVCLDVKGRKGLKLLEKLSKSANYKKNTFHCVVVDGKQWYLSIPKTIMTQARRPKVDLKGYTADAKSVLEEQAKEYVDKSIESSTADGCDEIVSVVHMYDVSKGYKISVLSEVEFEKHNIVDAKTLYKRNGSPAGYIGYNENGQAVYKLSSFNKGSSNMEKMYTIGKVYIRIWKDVDYVPDTTTPELSGTVLSF
jgi:hypothetical protein